MTYYKVIQDDKVIDAGFTWLTWNVKHRCLMICGADAACYVQGRDRKTIYADTWLTPVKRGWPVGEPATVVVIDAVEYDEIMAMLDGGEEIPVDPAPPEPEPVEPDEPVKPDERPMTVAEMREKITEQQGSIDMLVECLLEMSEVVYGG